MPVRVRGAHGRPGGTERVVRMVRAGRKAGDVRDSGAAAPPHMAAPVTPDPPDPSLARSSRGPLTVFGNASTRPAAWCHGG